MCFNCRAVCLQLAPTRAESDCVRSLIACNYRWEVEVKLVGTVGKVIIIRSSHDTWLSYEHYQRLFQLSYY